MILIAPSSSTIFPRSSNNKAVRQPHPFGARGSTVCRVVDSKLPSRTVSALEGQMSRTSRLRYRDRHCTVRRTVVPLIVGSW